MNELGGMLRTPACTANKPGAVARQLPNPRCAVKDAPRVGYLTRENTSMLCQLAMAHSLSAVLDSSTGKRERRLP